MASWRMAFRVGTDGIDLWPECRRLGIAIIQYDPLNNLDLSQYSLDNLPPSWRNLGRPQKTFMRRFVFEMKPKDTIYVQSGQRIVGKGRVCGHYRFDAAGVVEVEGVPWQHQRKITWLDVTEVSNPTDQHIATVKPLTNSDVSKIESQYHSNENDSSMSATESDLEGLRYEIVTTTTKRSNKLRERALRNAFGVCAVCDTDFSLVLDGRGVRVLQVHHKKMLSQRKLPKKTELSDLVVVCANCHLLLHLNSRKPLTVSKLRAMLGVSHR